MCKIIKSLLLIFFSFLFWFSSLPAQPYYSHRQLPHIGYSISAPTPGSGDQHFLVVLVDFSDQVGTLTQQDFFDQFFGTFSPGTFADFYKEASYNTFRVTGDVVGASGGTIVKNQNSVAYLRLPHPVTYYADGDSGRNVGNFPRDLGGVFHHTMQALDDKGFDFSPYVDNETGFVQNIIIIFAGRSSVESGDVNTLQPTGSTIDFQLSKGYGETSGGYKYADFTICPEKELGGQATIGVCVHEHGHSLGLPDLYDLAVEFSGVGRYSLMAYGTFGGSDGSSPAHPGSYEKIMLGWVTPREITGTDQVVTLEAIETNPDVIKLPVEGSTTEYFLLENRQLTGFNADLINAGLCKGLHIWHIDGKVISDNLQNNLVNTDPSLGGPAHPGVVLVEADGAQAMINPPLDYGDCEDVFQVGDLFNGNSNPSSKRWNGKSSGVSVEFVSEAAGVFTLKITAPGGTSNGDDLNAETSTITAKARKKSVRGKVKDSGTALSGVTVGLYKITKKFPDGSQLKTTTTKSKGNYVFPKLRRGTYQAKALDSEGAAVISSSTVRVK